jgi:cytochrome d ubiquinol oxidase subunit II
MLLGLIWRGVAFEFRFKADERTGRSGTRPLPGLLCRDLFQGVALGAFIDGFTR